MPYTENGAPSAHRAQGRPRPSFVMVQMALGHGPAYDSTAFPTRRNLVGIPACAG